jgi:hypothetical protein
MQQVANKQISKLKKDCFKSVFTLFKYSYSVIKFDFQ